MGSTFKEAGLLVDGEGNLKVQSEGSKGDSETSISLPHHLCPEADNLLNSPQFLVSLDPLAPQGIVHFILWFSTTQPLPMGCLLSISH